MKALIADDDTDFRDFLEGLLTERGLDVTIAEDGKRAIQAIETTQPDLLVLDLNMPGEDGIKVLEHLAQLPQRPQVVICSGYVRSYLARHGHLLTKARILPKPFDLQQLDELLDKLGVH